MTAPPPWSTLALVELAVLLVVAVILAVLVWRPYRGRRRTPEEALEADALRREQDRTVTDAIYNENRYNIPPRGRP